MSAEASAGRLLISGGRVLRGGGAEAAPELADILVENGLIAEIGAGLAADGAERLDATDRLVIPGFVNAHYHSHDVLAKGTMEEVPLEIWRLLALPPQYPRRSRAEIKARTLLGALECLRSGMTCVQDMVTLYPFEADHLDAVIEAYDEIGIRAVIALQYADRRGIDTIPYWREAFPAELHAGLSTAAEPDAGINQLTYLEDAYLKHPARHPRISWALGPSAPERCSPELLQRTRCLADRYDLPIFTHFYESKGMALQARHDYPEHGGSLIRRLEAEGLLSPRLNLAHSVWLLPEEIEVLARAGANVVLNPLSNLKLKSGIPPVRALQAAGVGIALGCDNCSCSDAQNMFQAMKLAALLAGVSDPEPGPPQAEQVFEAATAGGARAIGHAADLGRLEIGYRADLTLLNLTDPSYVPLNSALRQLVYTEGGRGVETVIVEGRVVIRDRRLATIDEADILARVKEIVPGFRNDLVAVSARVAALQPYLREAHRRIWAEDVGMNRLFTGH